MVLDSRDAAFTASYQTSCAKEETSLEATALEEKVSMVINLRMKHSQWLTQSQVIVILQECQYTSDIGVHPLPSSLFPPAPSLPLLTQLETQLEGLGECSKLFERVQAEPDHQTQFGAF